MPTVTFTPTTLAFGKRALNVPKTLEVSVTNTDTISAPLTSSDGAYSFSPSSVPPGGAVTKVQVTFTPTAVKSYPGSVLSGGATLTLTGEGVTIAIDPESLDFGQRMVGSSELSSLLVTNSGGSAVTVSVAGAGYSIVDLFGNSVSDLSVAPGKGKSFLVKFAPPSVGTFTGTLTAGTATAALTGVGVAATIDTAISEEVEAGVVNRLFLDVPNHATKLTMGRGISGNSYDGFGVSTTGDIFLNAIGADTDDDDEKRGRFWLQSKQDLIAQSLESNVQFLAKSGWSATAGGTVSLVGGGGVTIAAGFGNDPIKANGSDIPETTTADSINEAVTACAITAAAWDTLIGFGAGVRALYGVGSYVYKAHDAGRLTEKVVNKKGLVALNILGAVGGFGTVALNIGGLASGAIPGISMFALGGFLAGTPAYASVYAAAGLVLSSLYPFVFGLDCEVMGLKSVTLSGYRNATLQSHSRTTVHSDGDVEISADGKGGGGLPFLKKGTVPKAINRFLKVGKTKEGIVSVRGEKVLLGKSQVFGDSGEGAKIVAIAKTLTLQASQTTFFKIKENDWAFLTAQNNVEVRVGSYALMAKTDGIKIGKSAAAAADSPPADPALDLNDNEAILEKGTSRVRLVTDRAELRANDNAYVACTATDVFIKSQGRVLIM